MKTIMVGVAAATIWVITGLGPGSSSVSASQTSPTQEWRERTVIPSATDPAISSETGVHFVTTPSTSEAASGRLFVFLPGTGALPRHYRLIVRAAAKQGYHAVGLVYPNPTTIGSLCGKSSDVNCFWNTRREVVTGDDLSPLLAVDNANSIVNRLQKLVTYLDARYPRENWGQFLLSDGSVDWRLVVVGGQSQGGGHAGVMAKLYRLNRACYFGSPPDWSKPSKNPAAWLSASGMTLAESQYGFTHLGDTTVSYAHLSSIWGDAGLQMPGNAVSVDSQSPPYGNSHQLTTNAVPNLSGGSTNPYHAATVADAATPIAADGTPVYEPVWAYMCFQ